MTWGLRLAVIALAAAPLALFAADPNPEYEQVLVPLFVDQPINGAYGTVWRTELWGRNSGDTDVIVTQAEPICVYPGEVCDFVIKAHTSERFTANDFSYFYPRSIMLHVEQTHRANVFFSLRLMEVSTPTLNIEIPMVREANFLRGRTELLNVPVRADARITLRLYDPRRAAATFLRVRIFPMEREELLGETTVWVRPYEGPLFPDPFVTAPGYAELPQLEVVFPEITKHSQVRIVLEPESSEGEYWGFVSVTDNTTQAVSLITPQ